MQLASEAPDSSVTDAAGAMLLSYHGRFLEADPNIELERIRTGAQIRAAQRDAGHPGWRLRCRDWYLRNLYQQGWRTEC
jgi:hypothetical protein